MTCVRCQHLRTLAAATRAEVRALSREPDLFTRYFRVVGTRILEGGKRSSAERLLTDAAQVRLCEMVRQTVGARTPAWFGMVGDGTRWDDELYCALGGAVHALLLKNRLHWLFVLAAHNRIEALVFTMVPQQFDDVRYLHGASATREHSNLGARVFENVRDAVLGGVTRGVFDTGGATHVSGKTAVSLAARGDRCAVRRLDPESLDRALDRLPVEALDTLTERGQSTAGCALAFDLLCDALAGDGAAVRDVVTPSEVTAAVLRARLRRSPRDEVWDTPDTLQRVLDIVDWYRCCDALLACRVALAGWLAMRCKPAVAARILEAFDAVVGADALRPLQDNDGARVDDARRAMRNALGDPPKQTLSDYVKRLAEGLDDVLGPDVDLAVGDGPQSTVAAPEAPSAQEASPPAGKGGVK